ncbi:HET-domain-containing protein [Lentithecium fluviatile CBS 122367]|uniref:HET-domain-containing protein n=1 Tax=Lentithecium fluviatile CBS 122367 TaxID=1168545 RepID=A0A6G1JPY3_9PLEO|nr:HET-domain-containing protein [Lentithecium fluviatile CBS 122367]
MSAKEQTEPSTTTQVNGIAECSGRRTISGQGPPLYEYTPLTDSHSFRLLTIHPDTAPAPLDLSLTPVHFSDNLPSYEALSYVWGLEPGYKSATCNGRLLENVTTNLYEALERLRGREEERVVWVDALCIKQDDDVEKSLQVRMMHHIYARARRVVVWLGRDRGGYAQGAFRVLCALANDYYSAVYEALEDGTAVMKLGMPSCPPFSSRDLWKSVHMFFQNRWFLRMWVLQEIVLARGATVTWGVYNIDWDIIGAAIHVIRSDQTLHTLLESRTLQNAFFMEHLRTLHRPCYKKEKQEASGETRPFLHLLDIARSFDVTEPRDKVYGLLGFPTRDASLETNVFIVPDYGLAVSDVYTDVARKVLETDRALNVLSFVVRSEDIVGGDGMGMPSWVPNWMCKDIAYPFMGFQRGNWHRAGTARELEVMDTTDAKTLCLKGVVVDVLREVGARIPFSDLHASEPVLRGLVEWCLRDDVEVDTLAATLTAGRDSSGHIIEDPEAHLADVLALLVDLGIRDATVLHDQASSLRRLAPRRGDAGRAKEAVWRYSCYRAPFRTEHGRLGLGPGGARVGDKVVVLWGGQVPFVLREEGQSESERGVWRFVGEAYLNGVMCGEMQGLLDDGVGVEGVFEIR